MLKVMGDCGYGRRHTFTLINEGGEQFFSTLVHDVCLSPSTFLSHGETDSISTCAISWFCRTSKFGTTRNEKNRCQSQNWFALLSHMTHCLLGTPTLPFRHLLGTSWWQAARVVTITAWLSGCDKDKWSVVHLHFVPTSVMTQRQGLGCITGHIASCDSRWIRGDSGSPESAGSHSGDRDR